MFKTIAPGTANYEQLDNFLSNNQGNFDYNGLVVAINEAPVGSIITFPYRKGKLASLRSSLAERGLKPNVDFSVSGGHSGVKPDGQPDEESSWDVVLKKLTDTKGTPIEPKPRGKAAQAAGTEAAAAAGTAAATETAKPAAKKK